MNCAEGEWWDDFCEMWGDVFGRTEEFEAEREGCTLEEWRAIAAYEFEEMSDAYFQDKKEST